MSQSTNCKMCGSCCCNFPIYEHEATKIKDFLKTRPDLIKSLVRPFDHDGCIFLISCENNIRKCAIYNSGVRPTICKVFGTKGLNKLHCPENCFVGTKYTRKEAWDLISKNEKKSEIIGMMNDIMLPFIKESAKEIIMKEIFTS